MTVDIESPVKIPTSQVQSVAIIGGGASGSIALDSLVQEDHIKSITLFERRLTFGGIWNLDEGEEHTRTPSEIIKPGYTNTKTDPQLPNPFHSSNEDVKGKRFLLLPKNRQERFVSTPSYSGVKTNIIENIMTFSDLNHWDVPGETDPDNTRYVDGLIVRKYIETYIERHTANDKVSIIKNTTVEDIERVTKSSSSGDIDDQFPFRYKLTLRQSVNEESDIWWQETYDAVIVATGHYFVPFIPDVKGLLELQKLAPSVIHHAKYYRTPKAYKDKTIVVVGSRASGADITKYAADEATEVYQSIRSIENARVLSKKSNIIKKGEISEIQVIDSNPTKPSFKVIFNDGSELVDPDHIIYATGYQFSFPFLNRHIQNHTGREVTKEGRVIQNLYQHTFLLDDPLITFIGMPVDGVSFRVFEYQAVLVSRYLAGKVALPGKKEQLKWCEDRLKDKGITRAYHTIGFVDAPDFLSGLTKLGYVDTTKTPVGRPFPVLTEADLDDYKSWAQRLAENWDKR